MATLEKIRSKSVLLFIIIIVALLAFILGDFLTSGRTYFGSGTTVAKAGSAKVDYTDYQTRLNAAAENTRNQNQDNDELAQEVITTLLTEKMLQQEYDALGIKVTDKELSDALTGENLHPAAYQFIASVSQQLNLPQASGAAVFEAITKPEKYGIRPEAAQQLQHYWAQLEEGVEQAMLEAKFNRLVLGLFTANNLDAKNLYNDVATSRHFAFAAKPIASVEDKDVKVTDEDRKAAWEENKGIYKINEPIRSIDYIVVNIEPSATDRAAGAEAVRNALATLNSSEGTDAVASDSRFVVNRASATKAQIRDAALKAAIDTTAVGKAVLVKNIGDSYTLAKLLAITSEIDSINVSVLGRPDGASLDSLLAQANAGKSFAELIDGKDVQGQDSVWQSLVGLNRAEIVEKFTNNPIGQAFVLTDTVQGQAVQTLYRINRRHTPVAVYDIAVIDYTVDPSQETLDKLTTDLNTFVAANSNAEDFAAHATEAGYAVMSAPVMASAPHIANLPDSRSIVKWVMNAKPGKVMPVYQNNKQTYLLTVALKHVYEGEYLPWDADLIADRINADALRNVKAEKLIKQYAGKAKNVAGYAKAMGVEAREGDASFSSRVLGSLGFGESAVHGAIGAAKKGAVVGPIKGNNAVVVFTVTDEKTQGRDFDATEYASQFNRAFNLGDARNLQAGSGYLFRMLLGKHKVENNSLNFIQGFAE